MGEKVLDQRKPICRFFEEISQIPRETAHEKEISDYLINFAKERNLECWQDEIWNVVIKKGASAGYENADPIILQAHMDMVCSKTVDSKHNFRKDPIELVVEGNKLHAKDTSLGADDGFGVAYILAILDNDEIKHPTLECVITVQEEHNSSVGAECIDTSNLNGKVLLNLDGDIEDATYTASASSDKVVISHVIEEKEIVDSNLYVLEIKDITGNVVQGVADIFCGNAIKIIFKILNRLMEENCNLRICDVSGGIGDNRSPENAKVVFTCNEHDFENLKNRIEKYFNESVSVYEETEFLAKMELKRSSESRLDAMSEKESIDLIKLIYLLPNNMYQYSFVYNMAETVITLGIVEINDGKISIVSSIRSLHLEIENEAVRNMKYIAEMSGYETDVTVRYRSWPYTKNSVIRNLYNEVRIENGYSELEELICPGGLEIGWFSSKIPDLDALNVGVAHDNPHTYGETLDLDSFDRVYDVLLKVLARLR